MRARAVAVSMAEFHKAFHFLVSLFSPLATPPCITALRLLRSLFLSFLIDMQQPTSLNCVFYAPWFSALSSSLVFPYLGWLDDVSIYCLLLPRQVRVSFSFTHTYECEGLQNSLHHMCNACSSHHSLPCLYPKFTFFHYFEETQAYLTIRTIIPFLNTNRTDKVKTPLVVSKSWDGAISIVISLWETKDSQNSGRNWTENNYIPEESTLLQKKLT